MFSKCINISKKERARGFPSNVSTHERDLYGTWWADAAAAAVVDKGNRVKVVGAVRLRPATSLDAAGSLNVTPYIIQAEPRV